MSLIPKITWTPKQPGLRSEDNGYEITHRSITGITFAGYVVVGLLVTKLRSTTSSHVLHKIRLNTVIFSRLTEDVTTIRGARDGSQK